MELSGDTPNPLALTLPSAGASPDSLVASSGRYEIRREVGRGGQSVVYAAFDKSLNREVALKVPRVGVDGQLHPDAEARFLREARITARLEHPNIIAVHEIGRSDDGQLFCTQRLVRGDEHGRVGTLGKAMSGLTSLPERLALLPRLLAVCDAISYAHEQGVVHRDLKPDNVVLGRLGETVVLDWGIARVLSESEAPPGRVQTLEGQAIGTPLYMSPEQAQGRRELINKSSDVWSIGVMLYELLAGTPPHLAPSLVEVMDKVRTSPVPPLQQRSPGVPRALAALVMRALERDQARRYPDAKALADDLRAFLDGRTVGAHDYSAVELVRLFVSRNRTAAIIGVVSVVLLVAAVFALSRAVNESRASLASAYVQKARQAEAMLRWEEASAWYAAARELAATEEATVGLRSAWPRANQQTIELVGHQGSVISLASSADGHTLFSGGADGTVRIWDLATHAAPRVLQGSASVNALALSRDGRTLYSGGEDNQLHQWDLASGQGSVIAPLSDAINALAVSPDGTTIAVATEAKEVLLFELATGKPRWTSAHLKPVYTVAFSPDGATLVSASWDGVVKVWRVADGELLKSWGAHLGSVLSATFSPDGLWLATGGRDSTVRVWSTATWAEVQTLVGNTQKAYAVAWSRDGQFIASAGADGTSRAWSKQLVPLASASLGRDDELRATVFMGQSSTVATGGRRGVITVRTLADRVPPQLGQIETIALSELSDGRWATQQSHGFALFSPDLRQRESFEHAQGDPHPLEDYPTRGMVITRDGTLAVGSSVDGKVNFYDVSARRPLKQLSEHQASIDSITLSPDDQRLLTLDRSGRAMLWSVSEQKLIAELPRAGDGLFSGAFSPDGRWIVTAAYDRKVRLYDTQTLAEVRVFVGHELGVRSVAFSPDSSRIAAGGWDHTVRLWNVADGAMTTTLLGHQDVVSSVDFSPDGRQLASGSFDGTLRLWNLATNSEALRYVVDEGRINTLRYARDGQSIYYARMNPHRLVLIDERVPATLKEVLEATSITLSGLNASWTPRSQR